jgi:long-chain acyl-CoA synthetase
LESLLEFVWKYASRAEEVAVRYRRGYRMESWSYARVAQEGNRVARELESRGVNKGDAVVLWGENSPEWIAVFLGCVLRGAVIVPIDHGSTEEFASRIANEVKARVVFRARALPETQHAAASILLESRFFII